MVLIALCVLSLLPLLPAAAGIRRASTHDASLHFPHYALPSWGYTFPSTPAVSFDLFDPEAVQQARAPQVGGRGAESWRRQQRLRTVFAVEGLVGTIDQHEQLLDASGRKASHICGRSLA